MTPFTKVLWKEGAFLSPQHMQQLERSWAASMHLRFQGHNPLAWGLISLQLNEAAIGQGRLELSHCQAVMPDGTTIQIPEVDPAPFARSFELPATAQELDVYLTLPVARPRAPVSSPEAGRADVRFVERVLEVPDEGDPALVEPVEVAVKNLRLTLSGEPFEGLMAIRIARVFRSAEGLPTLRRDYIPPCLRIGASPALMRIGQDLVGLIAARARSLSEEWSRQAGDQLELEGTDALKFWFLHTLNSHASVLEHLVDQPGTHPAHLFEELLRLSGSLSTFALRREPGPVYRHDRLNESYGVLEHRLRELLARLFVTRYEVIPLVRKDSFWIGRIADDSLRARGEFFLAVTGDMPTEDLISRLPGACKIAEIDTIGRLVRTAVGGVRVGHVPRPPSPIPVRRDVCYFRVVTEGPDWEAIRSTGNVALYTPTWLPGLQFELIGLRAKEAG